MRLKLFRAATVTEAMAMVRNELGAEALIVSTRRAAQGVEVTAALEIEELPAPPAPEDAQAAMRFHGVPAELAAMLGEGDLAAGLARLLRFQPLCLNASGPPVLFTGTPGAGKTLSVARFATRLVVAGISPTVITTDGRRAGAAEELAAFTRLLGLGLIAASTPSALGRALRARVPGSPVLIDTAGVNPCTAEDLAELGELAAAAGALVVLVAQAGLDAAEAGEQAASFAQAGARFLLPTRLDLARRIGSVIAGAAYGRLILGEAGTGPGATASLDLLTAETLAGRLATHGAPPPPRRADTPIPFEAHHARHA